MAAYLALKLLAIAVGIAGVVVPVALIVSLKIPAGDCGLPFVGVLALAFVCFVGLFLTAAVLDKLAAMLRRR